MPRRQRLAAPALQLHLVLVGPQPPPLQQERQRPAALVAAPSPLGLGQRQGVALGLAPLLVALVAALPLQRQAGSGAVRQQQALVRGMLVLERGLPAAGVASRSGRQEQQRVLHLVASASASPQLQQQRPPLGLALARRQQGSLPHPLALASQQQQQALHQLGLPSTSQQQEQVPLPVVLDLVSQLQGALQPQALGLGSSRGLLGQQRVAALVCLAPHHQLHNSSSKPGVPRQHYLQVGPCSRRGRQGSRQAPGASCQHAGVVGGAELRRVNGAPRGAPCSSSWQQYTVGHGSAVASAASAWCKSDVQCFFNGLKMISLLIHLTK